MRRIRIIAAALALVLSPASALAQSTIVRDYLEALGEGEPEAIRARADKVLAASARAAGLSAGEYFDLVLDIGRLREETGDRAGAERAYLRAVKFGRRTFGPESLRLRQPLRGLAALQAARGDIEGAERTLLDSKAIAEAELGRGHPSTAEELERLAALPIPPRPAPDGEDRRGDYERALLRIEANLGASGQIEAPGSDPENTCAAEDAKAKAEKVVVFYATNRRTSGSKAPGDFYRNEYDRGAPVKYGAVAVSLPCNRELGTIPAPQLWRLELRADRARHVVLERVSPYPAEADFWSGAKRSIERSLRKEALVFIHGFNTDFAGAAMRTAQLAADTDLDGAPFFYDWPSEASLLGYNADRTIATEVPQITQNVADFLKGVAEETGAERISVIAHSMGNEPLLRALKLLAEGPMRTIADAPFDEVIFASPDVNVENFKAHVAATRRLAGNMTLYASERDLALRYSSWRSNFPRAGFAREKVVLDGLVSVDTTQASAGFIGHDDFSGNGLDDLRSIVWFGAKPEGRCVLRPLASPAGIWDFRPRCANADFKMAATLLRRLGLAESLRLIAATRDADASDRSLSPEERRRRLARAARVKPLVEALHGAVTPDALKAKYAAAPPARAAGTGAEISPGILAAAWADTEPGGASAAVRTGSEETPRGGPSSATRAGKR